MIRLSIAGQVVELTEPDFLTLLDNIAGGYHTLARGYNFYHVNGFAHWKNDAPPTLEMVGWETPMETVETHIDDKQLRDAFHSLREHLQELISIDEQIIEWLAGYLGLSSSQGELNRRRMDRRLHKISGRQGPIWAMQPEYQVFADRSKEHFLAFEEAKERMERRLEQLLGDSDRDGDSLPDSKSPR